jgi:hypothetical protein
MNIDRTIQLAHQLADTSGEIIRRYFRQPHLETETKLDQVSSIVTIADQEAEEAMVAIKMGLFAKKEPIFPPKVVVIGCWIRSMEHPLLSRDYRFLGL